MKKPTKETKKEIRDNLYLYTELSSIFSGSLQNIAQNILNIETRLKVEHKMVVQNPDKYIRFEAEVDMSNDEGSSYPEILLFGVRLETDEEFNKRIELNKKKVENAKALAEKRQKEQEQNELATFLRLKKKFENT